MARWSGEGDRVWGGAPSGRCATHCSRPDACCAGLRGCIEWCCPGQAFSLRRPCLCCPRAPHPTRYPYPCSTRVITDRETGRPRGFGFVNMGGALAVPLLCYGLGLGRLVHSTGALLCILCAPAWMHGMGARRVRLGSAVAACRPRALDLLMRMLLPTLPWALLCAPSVQTRAPRATRLPAWTGSTAGAAPSWSARRARVRWQQQRQQQQQEQHGRLLGLHVDGACVTAAGAGRKLAAREGISPPVRNLALSLQATRAGGCGRLAGRPAAAAASRPRLARRRPGPWVASLPGLHHSAARRRLVARQAPTRRRPLARPLAARLAASLLGPLARRLAAPTAARLAASLARRLRTAAALEDQVSWQEQADVLCRAAMECACLELFLDVGTPP